MIGSSMLRFFALKLMPTNFPIVFHMTASSASRMHLSFFAIASNVRENVQSSPHSPVWGIAGGSVA